MISNPFKYDDSVHYWRKPIVGKAMTHNIGVVIYTHQNWCLVRVGNRNDWQPFPKLMRWGGWGL